jgi:acid phosphatase (class A)
MKYPFSFLRAGLAVCLLTTVAGPLRADDLMALPTKPAKAVSLRYLAAGQPDAVALLAAPPLPGSAEQAADLATVREVYHAASSNDIAAAYSEKKFSVFNFTPAVGSFFQSDKLPKTAAFFERVQGDATVVTDHAKALYKRPRPFVTDPALANGKLEKSFGYPSGHSAESMVLALVLAELFPEKHDAIIAHARDIGWRRVEVARHYPTDIYAGRVLAAAIVREMNASPDFQKDLAEARNEIAALQAATAASPRAALAAH